MGFNGHRKHFFNFDYFKQINTEEKAYWLGFLYADGHVSHCSITITLQLEDLNQLKNFLKSIEASNIEPSLKEKTCSVFINSIVMAEDLRKLGFTNRKTYDNDDFIFTQIPDKLKFHFIRGFWDGDGCIMLRQGKFNYTSVISLNKKLLESFCNYFNKYLNDETFSEVKTYDGYHRITLGSRKAKQICDLFYKDAHIFMERKYEKYLQFKTYNKNYFNIRQRKNGKYSAYIKINYKQKSLGTYNTIKEAIEAYNRAAIEYNRPLQKYVGESLTL